MLGGTHPDTHLHRLTHLRTQYTSQQHTAYAPRPERLPPPASDTFPRHLLSCASCTHGPCTFLEVQHHPVSPHLWTHTAPHPQHLPASHSHFKHTGNLPNTQSLPGTHPPVPDTPFPTLHAPNTPHRVPCSHLGPKHFASGPCVCILV